MGEVGLVVGFAAGVVTGGRFAVEFNIFLTGVGKVAGFNAGGRVGLGYGPKEEMQKDRDTLISMHYLHMPLSQFVCLLLTKSVP